MKYRPFKSLARRGETCAVVVGYAPTWDKDGVMWCDKPAVRRRQILADWWVPMCRTHLRVFKPVRRAKTSGDEQ